MRARGAALELGMELGSDEPGMLRQFDHLYQTVIGGTTAHDQPVRLHAFAKLVVVLVAMAVSFEDNWLTIRCIGPGARREAAHPVAQAHRPALSRHRPDAHAAPGR